MRRPALLLAALLCLPAQAEIYRIVGPDGSITFTDQPVPGAQPMELAPMSTYSPPPMAAPVVEAPQEVDPDAAQPYRSFLISSPAPDTTIRDNTGTVSLRLRVDPPLQANLGHRIQFMLDGVEQGEPGRSSAVTFENLDRGSHTLSARLVDADGATLETTPPVTVFVHRASALFPGRQ